MIIFLPQQSAAQLAHASGEALLGCSLNLASAQDHHRVARAPVKPGPSPFRSVVDASI